MKSILRNLLLLSLFISLSGNLQAQVPMVVHGYVNNLINQPLANKPVHIQVDSVVGGLLPFTYTNTQYTDPSGFYMDSVFLPAGTIMALVRVYVHDCYNQIQNVFQWFYAPVGLPLINFSICDTATPPIPCDAGVISIMGLSGQIPANTPVNFFVMIMNFGSDTVLPNTLSVGIILNGGTPMLFPYTGSNLTGYMTMDSLVIPNITFQPWGNTLAAYTILACDSNPANNTTYLTVNTTGVFSIPFTDNFDSLNVWSTNTPVSLWQRGAPNGPIINGAFSGTNAWVTNLNGQYPNGSNEYLTSPTFSFLGLSPMDTAVLSFQQWMAVADPGDWGRVQYSLDGGLTWATLGFMGDPLGTNWYNTQSGGVHYFSLTNTGWMYSSYRLDPNIFSGQQNVKFRFHFWSNAANTSDGWAIDDFSITQVWPNHDVGVLNIVFPVNDTLPGTPIYATIQIKNYGTITQNLIPVSLELGGLMVAFGTWTGTLPTQDTVLFTFPISFSVPAGPYMLCALTQLPNDFWPLNDQYCRYFPGLTSPTGYLYGMLTANATAAGPSEVYLIEHNTLLGTLTAFDTALSVDSAGVTTYYFSNVPPGNYLVKASILPANPNYAANMPTYYLSSLYWSQATTVNVLPNAITQASISYLQGINPGGPGFIGGLISQGANKGPGDPIEGVEVLLLDALHGDQPVAITYSDASGLFGFSNLAYGTYKVYAEMINKTTYPVVVSIDTTTPSTDGIHILVGTQIISYIQDKPGFKTGNIGNIHPNPATGLSYLPVDLEQPASVKLETMDLTGKIIRTTYLELPAGPVNICLDVSDYRNGIYLVCLTSGDGSRVTRKLVRSE